MTHIHNDPLLRLTITHLHSSGCGVAQVHNQIYHVPFCLKDEVVEALVLKKTKGVHLCKLVRLIESSPKRVTPLCPHFGTCGGCSLQHMDIAEQLRLKTEWLANTLYPCGNFTLHSLQPSPQTYHYRNRITLHHNHQQIGFYKNLSHDIVSVQDCALASPALNHKLKALPPTTCKGPTTFELREDSDTGFTQINTLQNENLIKTVLHLLPTKKSQTLLELYCGSGNLSLHLAARVKQIMAFDSDQDAIQAAQKQKKAQAINNLHFKCQTAHDTVFELCQSLQTFDVIVCDPPREGLKETVKLLPRLQFKQLIYVSCNPDSFVSDMRCLHNQGCTLQEVYPLDMFPHTRHIEIIASVRR